MAAQVGIGSSAAVTLHGAPVLARLLRSAGGYEPLVVTVVLTTVVLSYFGTPVRAVVLYAVYLLLVAIVPGTLAWRMLRVRSTSFLEDVAVGSALGVAIQVLLTYALRMVGAAHLAVLWAVAVIALCVFHPPFRQHWRTSAKRRTPQVLAWGLALTSLTVVWVQANTRFRTDLVAPIPGRSGEYFSPGPYIDMMFHQALSGAVLRGANTFPYVPDSPLNYTMMVYEHIADAARWVGVDLTLLTMRLHTVVFLALGVVLIGVIAHRISGSAVAGVLGAAIGYLATTPLLYQEWRSALSGPLTGVWLWSPTQTFGQPLFHALIFVVLVALWERRTTLWIYLPMGVLTLVVGGSKVTFLPKLICGLAAALLVGWIVRSGRSRQIMAMIAIIAAGFAMSMAIVTGTDSRGLGVGSQVEIIARNSLAGSLGSLTQPLTLVAAIALFVWAWSMAVPGAFAAVATRTGDLRSWVLLGIGVAGVAAALLTNHPGLSQAYFLIGAWQALGALAGVGLADLVSRSGRPAPWSWLVRALCLGVVAAAVLRQRIPFPGPFEGRRTYLEAAAPLIGIIAVALVVAALTALLVWYGKSRQMAARNISVAGVVVMVAVGVLQGATLSHTATAPVGGLFPRTVAAGTLAGPPIPADGAYVARWVREQSGADERIITNMHCVPPTSLADGNCNARHFWLAALSERHVLLEGWSYVKGGSQPGADIFWAPEFFDANEAAVTSPSPETIAWMRAHDARWIIVDREVNRESPDLARYTDLVLERGSFAVYRLDSD